MRARAAVAVLLCALGTAVPAGATAQEREPLFSGEDLLWLGGFAAGAAALAPLDVYVAREIQDSIPQANRVLRFSAGAFRILGFPGTLAITGGLYAGGLLLDGPGVAAAGLHATEAVLIAEAATFLAKGLVGRARPFLDPAAPFDVRLGRGFTHDRYQAFPSGHTSAAFATASALTTEIGYRAPAMKTWSGVVMYSAATLVGVSRMYHNAHWTTDVLVGAALGTFAGWKVVRYHHTRPDNFIDRALLVRGPAAGRSPIVLVWRIPVR